MFLMIAAASIAAASPQAQDVNPTPCGLEEVPTQSLRICPPRITYDEDGNEVGEEARQDAGGHHDR